MLKRATFLEYLLDIKFNDQSEDSHCTFAVTSVEEVELLPEEARMKLAQIAESINIKKVHRVIFNGEIRLADYEFGQTCVSFVGNVREEERSGAKGLTTSIPSSASKQGNFMKQATRKVGVNIKKIKVR